MKRPTVKKHALIAVITASVLAASCTLPVLAANASAETDRTSVEADLMEQAVSECRKVDLNEW